MNFKNKKRILQIFTPTLFLLFFAANNVFAQGYKLLAPFPTLTQTEGVPFPVYLKALVVLIVGLSIIFAVIMIVIGGIEYVMAAVPSAKSDGKKKIMGAIGGLILAIFSYLLLYTINPDLTLVGLNLRSVTVGGGGGGGGGGDKDDKKLCVSTVKPSCSESCKSYSTTADCATAQAVEQSKGLKNCGSEDAGDKECISKTCLGTAHIRPKGCGGGGGGGGNCSVLTNNPYCNPTNLEKYFGGDATAMSRICNLESGGKPDATSGSDCCTGGSCIIGGASCQSRGLPTISFGLFQINLTQNTSKFPGFGGVDCSKAFSGGHDCHCTGVSNQALYNQCKALASDPSVNLQTAKYLYDRGRFSPWITSARKCGVV
jgi:hypothetical protein